MPAIDLLAKRNIPYLFVRQTTEIPRGDNGRISNPGFQRFVPRRIFDGALYIEDLALEIIHAAKLDRLLSAYSEAEAKVLRILCRAARRVPKQTGENSQHIV